MIHPIVERTIFDSIDSLMIPADDVASVISTHTLNTSLLILSQVKYTAVPVLTPKNQLVGLISMPVIISAVTTLNHIELERLDSLKVADINLQHAAFVTRETTFEQLLSMLIDHNFVCVVESENNLHFKGIITRRTLLTRMTNFIHSLDIENFRTLVKKLKA